MKFDEVNFERNIPAEHFLGEPAEARGMTMKNAVLAGSHFSISSSLIHINLPNQLLESPLI
jgi:hypothetical protein